MGENLATTPIADRLGSEGGAGLAMHGASVSQWDGFRATGISAPIDRAATPSDWTTAAPDAGSAPAMPIAARFGRPDRDAPGPEIVRAAVQPPDMAEAGEGAETLAAQASVAPADGTAIETAGRSTFIWTGPQWVTFTHDGIERRYIIDLPTSFDPAEDYGAVMAFHGGGINAPAMYGLTGLGDFVDDRDFIAVFAEAAGGLWNDGRPEADTGIDDIGYVGAIIDQLSANWSVDADRVFAGGASNGGMFVQRLALDLPDGAAAIAAVVANMPVALSGSADTPTATPGVFFHGSQDRLMPFDGGRVPAGQEAGVGGEVLSAEDTLDFWADANATMMGDVRMLPDIADDGMTVDLRLSDDGSLAHYVVNGGGHSWPGADSERSNATQDIDATEIMLDFFEGYGL